MKKSNIFLLIAVTSLMLIKVYVANEIYYTSRDIQKLSIHINALKEERNILKLNIEKLKYKNTIIDPLFEYKPKPPKPIIQQPIEQPQGTIEYKEPPKKSKPKDTKELFENLNIDSVDEELI
jgi:regulator of replication initiation timing